jgi:hypothetical protein
VVYFFNSRSFHVPPERAQHIEDSAFMSKGFAMVKGLCGAFINLRPAGLLGYPSQISSHAPRAASLAGEGLVSDPAALPNAGPE